MQAVRRTLLAAALAGTVGSLAVPVRGDGVPAAPAGSRAAFLADAARHPERPIAEDDFAPGRRPDATAPQADPAVPAGADAPLRVIDEGFNQADLLSRDGRHMAPGGLFTQGWIRQNNSDRPANTWQQGLPSMFLAQDGPIDAYIGSHPFATLSDQGTISSWLLTPPINFTPTTRLSFYTREVGGSTLPTRLQVRACNVGTCTDVGTEPGDVGQFATLVLDINPTEVQAGYPAQWTRYTLTAAEGLPTSGSGRIAFRHHVHQDDGLLRGGWLGLDRVVVEQGSGETSPLGLEVTVSHADPAAPAACGSATAIDVAAGDQVNLCYRVTNHSGEALRYHALRDDQVGPIFDAREEALAPGATLQHNRIVTVSRSMSPSSTWMAQALPDGYAVEDTAPAAYVDATGGTPIEPNELFSGAALPFPADFDFRLFGERVDELCVTGFGVIASKRSYGGCSYNGLYWGIRPLPDSELTIYGTALALFETRFQAAGDTFHTIVGTAPNRRYVIEYHQWPIAFGLPQPERGLKAQVILNEGSHLVEFQYANVLFGGEPSCAYGGCAGIGLQNKNRGWQYSFGTPSLRNVSRIAWRPTAPVVHTRTRQVQITAHGAVLALDAERIDAQAEVGGQATARIGVANAGDGRLDWQAGVTAANSHLPVTPRLALPLRAAGAAAAFAPLQRPVQAAWQHGFGPAPALPATTPAGQGDHTLWAFDVWNAMLVSADPAAPGYAETAVVEGYPGVATFTGTDFLDDDFTTLYALDADTHTLRRFTPTTVGGSLTQDEVLGTVAVPAGTTPSGLKQDPTTGAVYMATADGAASTLWRVDPLTAATWLVGPISDAPGIISMDFDNDGNLYGLDVVLDALVAIDKTTGAGRIVGSLGAPTGGSISALAFDPAHDDRFHLATVAKNRGWFWTVDKATGQAQPVGQISGPDGGLAQFGAMAIARPGNRCVELSEVPWLTLSQPGGTIEPGTGAVELELRLDASGLAAGVHHANLCLHSNDLNRRRAAVPVTFTVGGDGLFADGFD